MNWTEIYRDSVGREILLFESVPPEGVIDLTTVEPCRVIPCPGSYFSRHDDACEMVWEEEDFVYTVCHCEERARDAIDCD